METTPTKPEEGFFFKYVLSMFMEARINGSLHVSFGRVLLAVLTLADLYIWLWLKKDVPPTMGAFTLATGGYVLGSKAIDTGKSVVSTVASVFTKSAPAEKLTEAEIPPPKTFSEE